MPRALGSNFLQVQFLTHKFSPPDTLWPDTLSSESDNFSQDCPRPCSELSALLPLLFPVAATPGSPHRQCSAVAGAAGRDADERAGVAELGLSRAGRHCCHVVLCPAVRWLRLASQLHSGFFSTTCSIVSFFGIITFKGPPKSSRGQRRSRAYLRNPMTQLYWVES